MGRGLGPKQREMLDWLREQWAQDSQPTRSELMGRFVVDKGDLWQWDYQKRDQLRKEGGEFAAIYAMSFSGHPERPTETPRPVAEAYRRALRTLIDRGLVKVVVDADGWWRYTDPEAENPLRVTGRNHPGRSYTTHLNLPENSRKGATENAKETGRRREPKISRSEKCREIVLSALPTDGSWLGICETLETFYVAMGGDQSAVDRARASVSKSRCFQPSGHPLVRTYANTWMRAAMLQLQKAGKIEVGTIPPGGADIVPKRYNYETVAGVRLCVA